MMKPAVAPMVKPAHMEDMRMLEGEPASSQLLRAHTPAKEALPFHFLVCFRIEEKLTDQVAKWCTDS